MQYMTFIVGALTALYGMAALAAWFSGSDAILRLSASQVSLKPVTALCFVFVGALLLSVRKALKHALWPSIVVSTCALWIAFLMVAFAVDSMLSYRLGFHDLLVRDPDSTGALRGGSLSVGTMLSFSVVTVYGLVVVFNSANYVRRARLCGYALIAVSGVALGGYVLGAPVLYYSVPGYSTSMALLTAALFFLTGLGVLSSVKLAGEAAQPRTPSSSLLRG